MHPYGRAAQRETSGRVREALHIARVRGEAGLAAGVESTGARFALTFACIDEVNADNDFLAPSPTSTAASAAAPAPPSSRPASRRTGAEPRATLCGQVETCRVRDPGSESRLS